MGSGADEGVRPTSVFCGENLTRSGRNYAWSTEGPPSDPFKSRSSPKNVGRSPRTAADARVGLLF